MAIRCFKVSDQNYSLRSFDLCPRQQTSHRYRIPVFAFNYYLQFLFWSPSGKATSSNDKSCECSYIVPIVSVSCTAALVKSCLFFWFLCMWFVVIISFSQKFGNPKNMTTVVFKKSNAIVHLLLVLLIWQIVLKTIEKYYSRNLITTINALYNRQDISQANTIPHVRYFNWFVFAEPFLELNGVQSVGSPQWA